MVEISVRMAEICQTNNRLSPPKFLELLPSSSYKKTADIITTAIFGDGPFKETPLERDRFEQLMLAMCQKLFPLDFMALVLDNPLCKTKWGDSYETIQVEVKHIEYPMPISDDNVEYESGEDFVELLFANPMDWKEILQAVIHYGNDNEIDTVIVTRNRICRQIEYQVK